MKIIHTADNHLDYYPREFPKDGETALLHFIEKCREYENAPIIIAGDFYDTAIPTPRAYEWAMQLACLPNRIYILKGNHDNGVECSPIKILQYALKNVMTFTEVSEIIDINGLKVLFHVSGSKVPEEACDIIVSHGRYSQEKTYRNGPYVDSIFNLTKTKYVALGDLHFPADYGIFHYCGAPWRMTFSQEGKSCGFNIIDTNTWETEHIELPSRKFITLHEPVEISSVTDAIVRVYYTAKKFTDEYIAELKRHAKAVRLLYSAEAIINKREFDKTAALKDLFRAFLVDSKHPDMFVFIEKYWA